MKNEKEGNPQLQDGYTRIANELLEAIMSRPFSKRETKIILYILRYSYGYQQKYVIDGMNKKRMIAEKTGIRSDHITPTLHDLIRKNVIAIEDNRLQLNKHYKEWITTPQNRESGNNPKQVKNNPKQGEQPKTGIPKMGYSTTQNGLLTPQNGLSNNPKRVIAPPTNTDKIKSAETPKEIYKENIKKYIKKESIEKEKPKSKSKSKSQLLKEKIRYNEKEGRFENFPEELISYFQEKYPGIDVKNVIKTMEAWIFTKFILKGKHSPYKDYAAALARWLAKEEKEQKQQKGGIIDYVTKGVSRYVGITKSEERNKKFKDEFIP